MFKCSECGNEYDIRPDYCDCGNDEFVEIKPQKMEIRTEHAQNNIINEEKNPEPEITTTAAYKPSVDLISLVIFFLCITLSFIVVFFVFNPKEQTNVQIKKEITTKQNIPSINSIWKETDYSKKDDEKPVEIKPVEIKPVVVQKINTKPKPAVKPTVNKSAQQSVKPKQKTKAEIALEEAQKAEQLKRESEGKKVQNNAQKLTEVKKTAEDLQTSMAAKKELAQYKIKLRDTIGKRIDFTRVVGDGECVISFKIDNNGRLINGAFAKQSSNITLNDAVYKAFMQSRSYNPPPIGYQKDTMFLNVKIYNGNFEIALK